MMLASMSGFLGSVWFAGLMCLAGYIVGCVVPISRVKEMVSK